MPSTSKVTPEARAQIIALLASGKSAPAIAKQYNLCPETIKRIRQQSRDRGQLVDPNQAGQNIVSVEDIKKCLSDWQSGKLGMDIKTIIETIITKITPQAIAKLSPKDLIWCLGVMLDKLPMLLGKDQHAQTQFNNIFIQIANAQDTDPFPAGKTIEVKAEKPT